MNGTIKKFNMDGHVCSLYLPSEYTESECCFPVIYMNGGDDAEIPGIMSGVEPHFRMDCEEFLLLNVQPYSWNNDYTPWTAPALNQNDMPFGGGVIRYLNFLVNTVKPYMDRNYKTKPEPENTVLIGYSLGGLAALFALYTSTTFGKIGSLSGSLWYDGWEEYMTSNKPLNTSSKVYLSLGKGEEKSRNQRMAKVGGITRKAAELLKGQLLSEENLILEWNNGGHFTDIHTRYQQALLWLMKDS